MGVKKFRLESRLQRVQGMMRVVFLLLSIGLIIAGLILAISVFFHLVRFTLNPDALDALVSQWTELLVVTTSQGDREILDPQTGPARWFAVAALIILGFLLSRIPLLLIRMGTTLFHASQDNQRQTRAILREVLLELRHRDDAPPISLPEDKQTVGQQNTDN